MFVLVTYDVAGYWWHYRTSKSILYGRDMEKFIAVGLGGFFGANARYFMTIWIAERVKPSLMGIPFGTMFVNVTGSFLLALFIVLIDRRITISDNLRLLIATGFFGAYTTFSTYAVESTNLLKDGNWSGGLTNIIVTNLLCLLGVILGIFIGTRL